MAEPTLYLFDGFNLLHAGGFGSPEELRDLLASWVSAQGARGVLVFDGEGPTERLGALEVRKLASQTFLGELSRPSQPHSPRGDLRDRLDPDTLARLERLRRGER